MTFSPLSISKLTKDREVTVDEYPFETINGCILKKEGRYHVGISSRLDEVKKRMTICHEIGHLETDTINGWSFRSEGKAYKRARELLIPRECLRDLLTDGFTDYSTLASLFGCSEKMVRLRCSDLGYA